METIKIVLLIGLVLFLVYVLMVLIREQKGVNTDYTNKYKRPIRRRVRYYN